LYSTVYELLSSADEIVWGGAWKDQWYDGDGVEDCFMQ